MIVEGVERWKAADVEAVAAYLADPDARGGARARGRRDAEGDSPLAELVAKRGEVLAYEVPRPKRPSAWVAQQFKRARRRGGRRRGRALVEIVGDDVDELSSEIEKIATWAGGRAGRRRARSRRSPSPARETHGVGAHRRLGARDLAGALAACEA